VSAHVLLATHNLGVAEAFFDGVKKVLLGSKYVAGHIVNAELASVDGTNNRTKDDWAR
jgi:hypothetical protein